MSRKIREVFNDIDQVWIPPRKQMCEAEAPLRGSKDLNEGKTVQCKQMKIITKVLPGFLLANFNYLPVLS